MQAMPAAHRQALRLHYAEYPPGDFRMQYLLAQLIIMFHSANKDKKSPPLKLGDFAPWLVTASMRKKRRDTNESAMRSQIVDMIAAANSKPS